MKSTSRFSSLIFVFAFVFSFILSNPLARAVTIGFDQVSWGNGSGGYEDQNSQWGEATLGFSGADASLLAPDGSGGFYGYVNVVTSVAGGSNNNWAVQNLAVSFNSLSDLTGGSLPTTVDFDLGQGDGTAVGSLNYSLSISVAPLALQPGSPLTAAGVTAATEVDGTEDDPSEFGGEGDVPASDFVGATAGSNIGARGRITGNETNVPAINEAVNGCGPGAAARSLVYLSKIAPTSVTLTQTAQQIYGTLTNYMQSSTGPNSSGTSNANFIAGKNAYFTTNGLSIVPTAFTNGAAGISAAINCLNATGDVEMGISWGFKVVGGITNSLGGHAVFVSQITPFTNSAGGTVAYQIRYIEDPTQGDGIASNGVKVVTVFPNGAFLNPSAGVQGSGAFGFFLENIQAVPEPSTFELAGFGIGALALIRSLSRRRKKRR
jgi:hypothetical protein